MLWFDPFSFNNTPPTVPTPTITNASFETHTPTLTAGQYSQEPGGPAVNSAGWTFSISGNARCGVECGQGPYSAATPLPDGVNCAYMQGIGIGTATISGNINNLSSGSTYTISFRVANRPASSSASMTLTVLVNGVSVHSSATTATAWTTKTATFTASAASHTLTFNSSLTTGSDATMFLDNITIV